MKKWISFSLLMLLFITASAQPDRWQQRIKYSIDVQMNAATNRFTGTEKIMYENNSPDTLSRLFFHLYWNAFQPNSMMDQRSQQLGKRVLGTDKNGKDMRDWDDRVRDRISHLSPEEIGWDSVNSITLNGVAQTLVYHETILEVRLSSPLLPHSKAAMNMAFNAQVPLQIRRSGRDNREGIRYSMSQWYPKMVEYDYEGWNANPYIAREFYGVWGDYNVNITIDKSYTLAGTGTIQNADEVGHGYGSTVDGQRSTVDGQRSTVSANLTWRFAAQNVHDFVWAADTAYQVIKRKTTNGPLLYIVYKKVDSLETQWQQLADTMQAAYPYIAKTFGVYPYANYSFIQGGDGGMEYPMATLIKNASIGNATHEWLHSWYQGMMGTNESLYPWMDEGFTTYAELRVSNRLQGGQGFPFTNAYTGYVRLAKSGLEEPMSTHADHYETNYAYSSAAYSKGAVFMAQLGYIVGEQTLDKILLEYYNEWRFKHPDPNDFIRVAEKVSGIELQWYKEYWIYTTKTIDYALGNINTVEGKTMLLVKRIGDMPMPVEVLVTYKDGSKELHYIPMNLMYGTKKKENETPVILHDEWKWTQPEYSFAIARPVRDIREVEIDPSGRLADVNRVNNKVTIP